MFGDWNYLVFGNRLYAQGRWWIKIAYHHDGWYSVVDRDALMPAPIGLIKQTEEDVKYQEILFRKF